MDFPHEINDITSFIRAFLPDMPTLLVGAPLALLWAFASLYFAGMLKSKAEMKTGYTRKIFHFLIFGTVVIVHYHSGLLGVCVFGGMTSIIIAYAIMKGSGNILYEAMAREKDAPRRTHYIVVPYFATLIGGLVSNILFPTTAVFGYLVTGLGDAVAEPVGTRFGKHEYKAPAIGGVRAIRTIEGSCAVFAASVFALTLCFAASHHLDPSGIAMILLISSVSTIVEAISPHGWDNATLQIVPSLIGYSLL